jgi:hypothetical protein
VALRRPVIRALLFSVALFSMQVACQFSGKLNMQKLSKVAFMRVWTGNDFFFLRFPGKGQPENQADFVRYRTPEIVGVRLFTQKSANLRKVAFLREV